MLTCAVLCPCQSGRPGRLQDAFRSSRGDGGKPKLVVACAGVWWSYTLTIENRQLEGITTDKGPMTHCEMAQSWRQIAAFPQWITNRLSEPLVPGYALINHSSLLAVNSKLLWFWANPPSLVIIAIEAPINSSQPINSRQPINPLDRAYGSAKGY